MFHESHSFAFHVSRSGNKGFPNFGAPLADPNAVPNEALQSSVDRCLRTICSALLGGVDEHDTEMKNIANAIATRGNEYILVGYNYDANLIYGIPVKNRKGITITEAWKKLHNI